MSSSRFTRRGHDLSVLRKNCYEIKKDVKKKPICLTTILFGEQNCKMRGARGY